MKSTISLNFNIEELFFLATAGIGKRSGDILFAIRFNINDCGITVTSNSIQLNLNSFRAIPTSDDP